ncbi:MAG: GatB/YqeY domain-containing protein [Candidatus Terrybacteria bacterium]|nr:GatB/YqeY domain-containing protein [Candidatus Terrybacteria bacterium]
MNLKEKIIADFKEVFKAKDEARLSVLKMLQAEIKNAEIAKRTRLVKKANGSIIEDECCELSDEEILEVIFREIKKRKKAIELYERGNRKDLAEKERLEIKILSVYLPEQLSEEEIRDLVKKAIEQSGAIGAKEMSKVMAILMPQVRGRADDALISRIVKELLG